MHDWATFLSSFFKKVQGIKSHHHFYAGMTGVAMRDFCDTASSYHDLLKGDAPELCPATMPLEIKGLDMKRQWYLYHSICEYVSTEKQDLVCPLPEVSVRLLSPPHHVNVPALRLVEDEVADEERTENNQTGLGYSVC
ncbi:hypothetical protein NP493_1878g00000 [Ridgeia piscesae]|uniref:Uncharacterized protein n=1 Tax=Ridgeia piscesae TaxID=27915 RepID=A0AAD9JQL2_RIDPI|nr:hypothetical protein NP493_1878g00000 [Ridgeia piscesae]